MGGPFLTIACPNEQRIGMRRSTIRGDPPTSLVRVLPTPTLHGTRFVFQAKVHCRALRQSRPRGGSLCGIVDLHRASSSVGSSSSPLLSEEQYPSYILWLSNYYAKCRRARLVLLLGARALSRSPCGGENMYNTKMDGFTRHLTV